MMATVFDLFGFVLLAVMVRSGLKKGLIDGVLKMVGIYAALYASMHYNQYGIILLKPLVNIPENYETMAGYAGVFLGVMFSISLISFILRKLVKSMHLGSVDKIGGITLGVAKAGLMLSAVVWAYAMVPKDMQGEWQQHSMLYPHVEMFAGYAVKILSLEDELALLQSTMGGIVGGSTDKLLEQALGGAGGSMGINSSDALKLISGGGGGLSLSEDGESIITDAGGLLGGGDDPTQSPLFKKALESLEGPQKELIEQAMQAMKSGNANSLLEGAIKSRDASGKSLMDEAMKYMDPTQKEDLAKRIREMDKELKVNQNKDR
ncbi:MAG: CvpA family protein [Candidatus Marinimicrobia bacterium]|nr:CvpA family protein [Candidatus Neomarinimicrobiota bacterium]